MKTQPQRRKFKKDQKGRLNPIWKTKQILWKGEWGLISKEEGRITSKQIEATELSLKRTLAGTKSKIIYRIFPHKPISKKPAETRMGKGKGSIDHYVATVRPGSIILELQNVPNDIIAKKALEIANSKLPVKTKRIQKEA